MKLYYRKIYENRSMYLTDAQQAVINSAIDLIKPYDKEDRSYGLHFFREKNSSGGEIGEEVCNNEKCVKKYLKALRKLIGKGKRIYTVYDPYDNGDHERISSCAICYRPLNEQLTWIEQEFDHHKEHSITKEDLTDSRTAFDVRCMLQAMPSAEHRISPYAIYQNELGNAKPLEREVKDQKEFVNEVVQYAELVIKVLSDE